jgi:hypothetical protein
VSAITAVADKADTNTIAPIAVKSSHLFKIMFTVPPPIRSHR